MTVVNLNYKIIYKKIEQRKESGTLTPDSAGQLPRFSGCCREFKSVGIILFIAEWAILLVLPPSLDAITYIFQDH